MRKNKTYSIFVRTANRGSKTKKHAVNEGETKLLFSIHFFSVVIERLLDICVDITAYIEILRLRILFVALSVWIYVFLCVALYSIQENEAISWSSPRRNLHNE